ncbi:hypothetical protein [Paenibacillus flagellatus]|uniref:Uncharacterized protein n=1 Tax=Paenibacillus flagellatus TaxID=2211139 RepID=A0A2V5KK67_9BACL|nr:hypothetical protein [Paenibacillus flagellatus]PYI55160.1 hypothetical protein DLM86_11585 [Paenibacillus flagellatus]
MWTWKEIDRFIAGTRDGNEDVEKCVDFLHDMQQSCKARSVPPVGELVAVLKVERPLLFLHVKQRVQSKPGLRLLFDLTLDYEAAKRRLQLK